MTEREVVLDFVPRSQFLPFHKRKQRWACLICHRRCGKTFATLMDLLLHALRKPGGRYAYIAPLYNQAKTVAWDVLKQFARPVLASPPNEAELRVDLIGGSRISLYGADNPDRLRGLGLDGVVLDEYADMSPSLFPALSGLPWPTAAVLQPSLGPSVEEITCGKFLRARGRRLIGTRCSLKLPRRGS